MKEKVIVKMRRGMIHSETLVFVGLMLFSAFLGVVLGVKIGMSSMKNSSIKLQKENVFLKALAEESKGEYVKKYEERGMNVKAQYVKGCKNVPALLTVSIPRPDGSFVDYDCNKYITEFTKSDKPIVKFYASEFSPEPNKVIILDSSVNWQ